MNKQITDKQNFEHILKDIARLGKRECVKVLEYGTANQSLQPNIL